MYRTAASILYRNLGSDGWPRHYYPDQETYALERYLLLEYIKTDLYEWQIRLGMLSPHAEPFTPATENLGRETEKQCATENNIDVLNRTENTKTEEAKTSTFKGNNQKQRQVNIEEKQSSEWRKYKNVYIKDQNKDSKEITGTNNQYEVLKSCVED